MGIKENTLSSLAQFNNYQPVLDKKDNLTVQSDEQEHVAPASSEEVDVINNDSEVTNVDTEDESTLELKENGPAVQMLRCQLLLELYKNKHAAMTAKEFAEVFSTNYEQPIDSIFKQLHNLKDPDAFKLSRARLSELLNAKQVRDEQSVNAFFVNDSPLEERIIELSKAIQLPPRLAILKVQEHKKLSKNIDYYKQKKSRMITVRAIVRAVSMKLRY